MFLPNATFLWVCTQGGYDPQTLTRLRFLYNAPTSQVSSSYVYSFGHYHAFGAVEKTSSSFSAHGKIGNFIIIHHADKHTYKPTN